jgi:hypothetical protein
VEVRSHDGEADGATLTCRRAGSPAFAHAFILLSFFVVI